MSPSSIPISIVHFCKSLINNNSSMIFIFISIQDQRFIIRIYCKNFEIIMHLDGVRDSNSFVQIIHSVCNTVLLIKGSSFQIIIFSDNLSPPKISIKIHSIKKMLQKYICMHSVGVIISPKENTFLLLHQFTHNFNIFLLLLFL